MNTTNNTQSANSNATDSTLAETISILSSFTTGQGKQDETPTKFIVSGLKVDYLAVGMNFSFQSESHKDAMLTMLMYNLLKDKSADYLSNYFEHMNSGTYLSLNHKSDSPSVKSDILAPYKTVFETIGVTKVEKTKGSKFYWLYINEVDESAISILTNDGFTSITPFLDGIRVGGLKVELPQTGN